MGRITVPAAKVLETLKAVASEHPDYVYAAPAEMTAGRVLTCFYVHETDGDQDAPGCLIGRVLHELGVPLASLSSYEGTGAYSVAALVLDITGQPDEIAGTIRALATAQDAQDNGATWGDALAEATRKPGE